MYPQIGEGCDLDNAALIGFQARSWESIVRQVYVHSGYLSDLKVTRRVVRAGFGINPALLVQWKAGNVTAATAAFAKSSCPILDRLADLRIAWDHTPWNSQSNLKNGCSRYVGTRQFVHEPVTIGIHTDTKTLFGLYSVVMVKSIIGELADRNDIAGLVVRTNNQVWRCRTGSRHCWRWT